MYGYPVSNRSINICLIIKACCLWFVFFQIAVTLNILEIQLNTDHVISHYQHNNEYPFMIFIPIIKNLEFASYNKKNTLDARCSIAPYDYTF
jgi:hypothetical protein